MKKTKVWEFLETLDSHNIYEHNSLAKEFKLETGHDACWPIHTVSKVATGMKHSPMFGDILKGHADDICAHGWEIAESLEDKFLKTNSGSNYFGRGRRFRASVEALKKANI